ncbi:MAG: tripartite tricarboxylate transporter substrate binding protein [Betaproteobacteria bacterium]|nr:tripartite tricarboxylate transporter substrate binding protein [Betaproteobacteria bacterium]
MRCAKFPCLLAGALALLAAITAAHAQPFPTKTLRMIVPATPGGSSDLVGRLIAEHLQKRLGQAMVTENRPGAGQAVGTAFVAKSEPDGHTLLIATVTYATNAALSTKLPYDPINDLTGVALVGTGPMLLTVHPSLLVRNVKELIALARTRAGTLDYASSGAGSIPHLAMELFAGMTKTSVMHVPYKSITPAVTAIVAGEVQILIVSTPSGGPMIKANRLRALAVTTPKRAAFLPELPTVAESGVPGYDVSTWWGILAPAKTPAAIVTRLNDEIRKIIATDEAKAVFTANGAEAVLDMSAQNFTAMLANEIGVWRKIVKERGIKME